MRISRHLANQAEANRAKVPYDTYGQCHAPAVVGPAAPAISASTSD